jgi:hypothetical protein
MKTVFNWLIITAIGFTLMLFSYFNYQYEREPGRWKNSLMYIGTGEPNSTAEQFNYARTEIRLLPMSEKAKVFSEIARNSGTKINRHYELTVREKIILQPAADSDLTADMLESGRLAAADSNEILAGYQTKNRDSLAIDGRIFKIVGRLKKQVRLFADSYLIFGDGKAAEIFDVNSPDVRKAYLVELSKEQADNPQITKLLGQAFPTKEFMLYIPFIRTKPMPFCLYIGGLTLLLLGGIFALFNIYKLLADRVKNEWLHSALSEICKYKKLFIGISLVYFGAVLIFMIVAYLLPELQAGMLESIRTTITDDSGPLAAAGKAYGSRNILLAAFTTFAINFPIGSVAVLTIPSAIIPGAGILVACFRAALWGLLLGPTFDTLSGVMLPHSFTLLLEGEGYILATFFGLLIPVYLFSKTKGVTVVSRYGKALLINLKGNLLVAIVLAISAIYEAVEVIIAMNLK